MDQNTKDFLKILVEDIHSTTIATIDEDGRPLTSNLTQL